jgi:Flp pilus assembly protein TadD
LTSPRGIGRHDPFVDSIAAFRESIRLKPDAAATHIALGAALSLNGDEDDAEAEFAEANRLNSDVGPKR